MPACILVLVVFLFCILYVTNLALWLQDFNKLTYLSPYPRQLWSFAAAARAIIIDFVYKIYGGYYELLQAVFTVLKVIDNLHTKQNFLVRVN